MTAKIRTWIRSGIATAAVALVGLSAAAPARANEPEAKIQAFLELSAMEELRIEWVGAGGEPLVVSATPAMRDVVLYEGPPPARLVLKAGRYWIWSTSRDGVVKITGRRVVR